ncbi:LysR family transcriptional regulator [Nocardia sp. CA-290969]|uniref:LysR family transcriptional regulator n=1 Tax=Nocardia sp. CA-290969 TaxID=3239986 RepID=UPI003D8D0DAD
MNLRQLEYFVAVADEGGFTRAAQRLYVAQPTLSKQIAALEHELGGPLFERLNRGVRLTHAGRAFLPEARSATLSANRARRAARMAQDLTSAELEIAAVLSIAIGLLPRSIRALRERYPGIAVELHEYRHKDLMEDDVRHGVADLAIGPVPGSWDGPIESLGWESFVLLLPEGDRLLKEAGPVELSDLSDRRWVLPTPTAGMAPLLTAVCRDAGFDPEPAVHSAQIEGLARFTACGLGPTMMPLSAVPGDLQHLVKHMRKPLARELSAYTRSEWTPLTRALLESCRDAVAATPRPAHAFIVG